MSRSRLEYSTFQFTPLREGRRSSSAQMISRAKFQFTPLREGRLGANCPAYCGVISIHAPPRGATSPACRPCMAGYDFNSRPSARGDLRRGEALALNIISIHAPPRGATTLGALLKTEREKFQFTPLREGRLVLRFVQMAPTWAFQFTPLREGRQVIRIINRLNFPISIHAPPRGATSSGSSIVLIFLFQFTPLREGRRKRFLQLKTITTFQFTPLREGRRIACKIPFCCGHFNSRPSARGDSHTEVEMEVHSNFNSRPSARGDGSCFLLFCRRFISIHAPPRGATLKSMDSSKSKTFQFTPLREGRPEHLPRQQPHCSISIHAPPRGATAKDMQFLQIFCSTLTNQHGLTIMPRNLSRLFW